jgi:hypothetical protein
MGRPHFHAQYYSVQHTHNTLLKEAVMEAYTRDDDGQLFDEDGQLHGTEDVPAIEKDNVRRWYFRGKPARALLSSPHVLVAFQTKAGDVDWSRPIMCSWLNEHEDEHREEEPARIAWLRDPDTGDVIATIETWMLNGVPARRMDSVLPHQVRTGKQPFHAWLDADGAMHRANGPAVIAVKPDGSEQRVYYSHGKSIRSETVDRAHARLGLSGNTKREAHQERSPAVALALAAAAAASNVAVAATRTPEQERQVAHRHALALRSMYDGPPWSPQCAIHDTSDTTRADDAPTCTSDPSFRRATRTTGFDTYQMEALERLLAPVRVCPQPGYVELYRHCRPRSHSVVRMLDEPSYYVANDSGTLACAHRAVTEWLACNPRRQLACDLIQIPPAGRGVDAGWIRLRLPMLPRWIKTHTATAASTACVTGAGAGAGPGAVQPATGPSPLQLGVACLHAVRDAWYEVLVGRNRKLARDGERATTGARAVGCAPPGNPRGKLVMRSVQELEEEQAAAETQAALRRQYAAQLAARRDTHDSESLPRLPLLLACEEEDWLPETTAIAVFVDGRAADTDTQHEDEAGEMAVVIDVGLPERGGEPMMDAASTHARQQRVAQLTSHNLHAALASAGWLPPTCNWRRMEDLPWLHFACRHWHLAAAKGKWPEALVGDWPASNEWLDVDDAPPGTTPTYDQAHAVWSGWPCARKR